MFKIMFGVALGIVLAGIINTGKPPWLVETVLKWIENRSHQAQQVMGNNSNNKNPKNKDGIIREESAKADSLVRKEPEGSER